MSETAPPYRRRGARIWLAALAAALLTAGAIFAYSQWSGRREDPLATMVTAFQKQNSLTVFRAQIATVVTSNSPRLFGLLKAEQIAVIPATVEYRLDLSRLGPDDFEWNSESQHMIVTLPPITVGRPNLDEGRARYVRDGVLVSGETQERLTRLNTQAATADAVREALNPQLVALARTAAREAMMQNVALPLRAAGYEDVVVEMRFADEARDNPSQLDRSRRIEDVLRERREAR